MPSIRRIGRSAFWLPLALTLACLGAPGAAHAATFVVTTTGDTGDTNTADNACVASGGGCTLRAAIQQANATAGADAIHFAIGTGPQTITPASALPAIAGTVTIDGRTQPGAAPPAISLAGASAGAGANGLVLEANGCQIYGLVVRNFGNHGIVVNSSGNTVARNHVGTDAAGTADQGNTAYGIVVTGSTNTIGGPAASYADRNVISGNNGGGLQVTGTGNTVQNNFIGVNRQGNATLANSGPGVFLSAAANNTFKGNIISGNTGDGVRIVGGSGNTIHENSLIGLNNGATADLGNGGHGVSIEGSANNVIGGTNLISGNGAAGVYITGATATGNSVRSNFIGLGYGGGNQVAIGNSAQGVVITAGANGNTIGGLSNGLGNVISGNGTGGVLISGNSVSNNVVSNVIGAGQGPTGTAIAIPNGGHGVQIVSSPNNKIGIDASQGSGNTISGNQGHGVYVTESNGTLIAGNAIGSGEGGIVPLANQGHGVYLVGCSDVTIGGDTSGEDNEISGNTQHGVYISGGGNNDILNNAIGIDGNGVVGVGNGGNGILLENVTGTYITTALISGNGSHGVRIVGGTGTVFRGNFVGTNLASNQAIPNNGHGLSLENTNNNFLGEPVSGGGNIISGNTGSGIFLFQSSGNVITNNILGLNLAASMPLPNGGHGVLIQASNDTTIGGAAQNIIAGNTNLGVALLSGARNQIRPNMIYANGGLGIDLDRDGAIPFDGVTFNDPTDGDLGANGLLNAPILTSATTTAVSGRVKTAPGLTITVDVYRSTSCDPAGFGEGSSFLGTRTVTTDANGVATWQLGIAAGNAGDSFTATATDASLNTSELSQCITAGRLPVETLALLNPSTKAVGLIATLQNLSSAPGGWSSYISGAPGTAGGGKWVMGDWNADGIDTPAVYLDNGLFYYTNDVVNTSNWIPIWFGLLGRPPVAGRFNPSLPHDCLGVVDSAPVGADTAFNLYYVCNLTGTSNPPKQGQWLSVPLPTSQGFSGTHQIVAGDFNNDGVDSIGIRRGVVVTWTNVAPASGAAAFNLSQYFGVPPGASGEGNAVVGDWDGDGRSSWGLFYQNGTFQRRNDLEWNSGVYVLQNAGQPIGTPTTPASWRPGGSTP
jgi:CSLREA domain-containing protein